MTLDLEPIRARLAAATPGPWHTYGNTLAAELGRCTCSPHYGAHEAHCGLEEIGQVMESDAELIAATPADLAALLAEVERLRETVQRVREMHQPRPYADDDLRAVAPSLPEFVCDHCRGKSDSAVPYPCPTLRALDGAS